MNLSAEEGRAIKHATRVLIGAVGTLDAAALHCRVDRSRLSKYQTHQHPEFMPVDVAYQLQMISGSHALTDELCRLLKIYGGASLPKVGDIHFEAMDVVPAVGRLIEFIRQAKSEQSDGGRKLTEAEKRAYFKLRDAVERELHDLDVAVQRDSQIAVAAE